MPSISSLDWAIIGFYFLLLILIRTLLLRRKHTTHDEYFLAGRSLPWVLIMTSLFATDMSSMAFIGASGNGYTTGLVYANFQWIAVACVLVLVTWLLPTYLHNRIVTMPEYLLKRFGLPSQVIYSGISLILYQTVEIPMILYATSLLIGKVANISYLWIFIVVAVVTGIYTAVGGLRAVVYADFMQTVFILAGGAYVSWVALQHVGGLSGLRNALPDGYFHAIQPVNALNPSTGKPIELPWPAMLTSLPVLGLWYWTTNQYIMQRVLGARSLHQARLGTLGAGFLKFTLPFLILLPGMCGRVLFPDLEKPDEVYQHLITTLVPVGFKGLVIAALIAALMSHAEACLNSASTLYVNDIHRRIINPDLSDRRAIFYGKLLSMLIMAISVAIVPALLNLTSIYNFLQLGYAYIAAPAVVLFLGGVFWRRANAQGAIAAYVGGVGGMAAVTLTNSLGLTSIVQYYQTAIAFASAAALFVVVSLLTPPPTSSQIATAPPASAREARRPLIARWQTWAIVLALTLAFTYVRNW